MDKKDVDRILFPYVFDSDYAKEVEYIKKNVDVFILTAKQLIKDPDTLEYAMHQVGLSHVSVHRVVHFITEMYEGIDNKKDAIASYFLFDEMQSNPIETLDEFTRTADHASLLAIAEFINRYNGIKNKEEAMLVLLMYLSNFVSMEKHWITYLKKGLGLTSALKQRLDKIERAKFMFIAFIVNRNSKVQIQKTHDKIIKLDPVDKLVSSRALWDCGKVYIALAARIKIKDFNESKFNTIDCKDIVKHSAKTIIDNKRKTVGYIDTDRSMVLKSVGSYQTNTFESYKTFSDLEEKYRL